MWGLQNADVTYRDGHGPRARAHRALDSVHLTITPGEVAAIVGGDGSGKTTALRALMGLVPLSSGQRSMPPAERIGYQPATSGVWRELTVAENLDFVASAHQLSGARWHQRRTELIERAKLGHAVDRLGGKLSGGMRQKLGVIMALLPRPEVLLLDEPSTGVDPVSRVELWRMIADAAAEGTAILMSTTYLDEAERATEVTVLHQGAVLTSGTPTEIIEQARSLTKAARPAQQTHTMDEALIALTLAATTEPAPVPVTTAPTLAVFPRGGFAIEVQHARRTFGAFTAVDDVSFTVAPGEVVGLLGANGAGKTTLIRAILGLDALDGGAVTILGQAPGQADRQRWGYVPQGLGLAQALTVTQNIEFTAAVYGVASPPPLPPALHAVHDQPVHSIGLGLRRQLAFFCALLHQPQVLIVDEPTSGVDPLARARLWEQLHAQAARGVAVLVTTHYLQEAGQCTRLHVLSRGRHVTSGSVADITAGHEAILVDAAQWQDVFTVLAEAGMPVMLVGRTVRVAAVAREEVMTLLARHSLTAQCTVVPATLEETMVTVERAQSLA